MKVDCYRNLNDKCISIRSRETEDYGSVVAHEPSLTVVDVEFVVQPSAQRKAREKERKNVHAVVRGRWNESNKVVHGTAITYDPFKYDYFVTEEDERPVEAAEKALVTTNGVYAEGIEYR